MECGTWLAGSEAAFYPDNKTYIQTLIPRVAFISSHTAALTPGHLAVLLSIDVKWPEVPPGMGRARSDHNGHWPARGFLENMALPHIVSSLFTSVIINRHSNSYSEENCFISVLNKSLIADRALWWELMLVRFLFHPTYRHSMHLSHRWVVVSKANSIYLQNWANSILWCYPRNIHTLISNSSPFH